jgi:predicted metal-binding transcription factor (methanogenesis marker protein 9)
MDDAPRHVCTEATKEAFLLCCYKACGMASMACMRHGMYAIDVRKQVLLRVDRGGESEQKMMGTGAESGKAART